LLFGLSLVLIVSEAAGGGVSFSREGLLPQVGDHLVTLVHALKDFTVQSGLEVVGGAVFTGENLLTRLLKVVLDDLEPTPVLLAHTIAESLLASPTEILRQVAFEGPT